MVGAPEQQKQGGLSEAMKRIINGEATPEEKHTAYQGSLQRWWAEYASRKNHEDDAVADSLLYDERCHLPRTTPGPNFTETCEQQQKQEPGEAGSSSAAQQQQQQHNGASAQAAAAAAPAAQTAHQ